MRQYVRGHISRLNILVLGKRFLRSVVYESVCVLCHPDGKKVKAGDSIIQSGAGTYRGERGEVFLSRQVSHMKMPRQVKEVLRLQNRLGPLTLRGKLGSDKF